MKYIMKKTTLLRTGIKELNTKELLNYNGGGILMDAANYIYNAYKHTPWDRMSMSASEKESFIREHGLRD